MSRITYETFQENVTRIHEISCKLNDLWSKDTVEDTVYLKKRVNVLLNLDKDCDKGPASEEACVDIEIEQDGCCVSDFQNTKVSCSFEYHVLYSVSYQVPVLFFNAYQPDGSLLSLKDLWDSLPEHCTERLQHEKWTFITQQEHPLFGRPFFQLHPCHTATFMQQINPARNYVLAWLSSVGPVVHLEIPLEYAKLVADGYECIKTDS